MSGRLNTAFAAILESIELQPLMLHRAAAKAASRRFSSEPMTGFGELSDADAPPDVEAKRAAPALSLVR